MIECAEISTARTQPRSALKRKLSGGRPPLDSPSPKGSTRPFDNRSFTTFVTVGALKPVARTRSAREHEPDSRKSVSMLCALVWRSTAGLPTGIGLFLTSLLSLQGNDSNESLGSMVGFRSLERWMNFCRSDFAQQTLQLRAAIHDIRGKK